MLGGEVPFPKSMGFIEGGEKEGRNVLNRFAQLPKADVCRLIEFDQAQTRPGFVNGTWFLIVSGTKPATNVKVALVPTLYIEKPDYWEIQVVGCLAGIGNPVLTPYTASLEITHFIGHKGVKVVGANKSEEHSVS